MHLLIILLFFIASQVFASGFILDDHASASVGGNAMAGRTVFADDASAVYYNPAAMALFERSEMAATFTGIFTDFQYDDKGSTLNPNLVGAAIPMPGGDSGSDLNFLLASTFYIRPINDKLHFGLSFNAPFGLGVKYDRDWVGRYHNTETDLKTINLNPTISYKVNDSVSLGMGLSLQYMKAMFENAVDLGLLGGAPFAADGYAKIEGDSFAVGFNIGALFVLNNNNTRIGFAYRSGIKHTVEGDAEYTANIAALTGFSKEGVKTDIDLPGSLSVSLYQKLHPKWVLLADVTWIQWSSIDKFVFDFDNSATSTLQKQWNDTFRIALGVNYIPNAKNTFRAGLFYDESPIDDNFRDPSVPDSDHWGLTFGYSRQVNDRFGFDLAAYHLIFPSKAKVSGVLDTTGAHILNGEYSSSYDYLGAQVRWKF